jgi:hypothetical protein
MGDEHWARRYPLAAGFAQLAERLFTADDLPGVVRHLVAAVPPLMPGTDLASVTVLNADGRFRTPAHTDPVAVRLDEAQYQADDGPCLEATRTGGIGVARWDDLAVDPPWPEYAAAAVRLGVRSVVAVGLFPDSDPPRLGALNLYSRRSGALADADLDIAVVLAAHLATALVALHRVEEHRDRVLSLRQALDTRDVIGQAKGILMARGGLTAEEAFEVLSRTSQRLNARLRDVAEQIIRDPVPDA